MSNLIERVARAIFTHNAFFSGNWDRAHPAIKDEARRNARAAIEAMRSPSDDLLYEGYAKVPNGNPVLQDFRDGWESVIDAALKEGK